MRIATAIRRLLRRRPTTSAAILFLAVLLFVPVWPFFPSCDDGRYPGKTMYRYMSKEYRYMLKTFFDDFGVYYWDIGGVVLLRVHPFLDAGDPVMHHSEAVLNAQNRAASALSDPIHVASPVGRKIDGRPYRIPAFVTDLIRTNPDFRPATTCEVMPYIVTMTPPPGWSAQ
jgi:hypothetical protein